MNEYYHHSKYYNDVIEPNQEELYE